MKAIITVVGKDKSGIVAGVATKVAELGLNIDDISQTVASGVADLGIVGENEFMEMAEDAEIVKRL